jgi:hypothetical protein
MANELILIVEDNPKNLKLVRPGCRRRALAEVAARDRTKGVM